jgi:hypothetical protein
MKISRQTASYDSDNPHWDQRVTFADGTFTEYGGCGISRWDYRITNVIVSEYSRTLVSIVGRCLSHPKRSPDFLSIRIGALRPKYVPLSIDSTAFVSIDSKGLITVKRRKIDTRTLQASWGRSADIRKPSASAVVEGVMMIGENTEPSPSPYSSPATGSESGEA